MKTLKKYTAKFSCTVAGFALAASAHAGLLSFDLSVTGTGYSVTGSETAASLLAEHASGSAVCSESLDGFVSVGPRQSCGINQRNYSLLLRTEFELGSGGNYRFQTGADWGRGGGLILTDRTSGEMLLTDLTSEDIWWRRNWNNADVFISEFDLDPGAYALTWIGFEGCCAGETSIRYSFNGGDFENFNRENFSSQIAAVPEPGTVTLLGLGLVGFIVLRKRRSSFQAMRAEQKAASDAERGVPLIGKAA